MKRLLYLAILSMAILTVSAPAALAQQGGGLCPGAQAVTSFSGTANVSGIMTEPFYISTEKFQVAVDFTSSKPEGNGSTYVAVGDGGGGGKPNASRYFGYGEDGILTVSNAVKKSYALFISGSMQAYDITVYECPGGGQQPGDDSGQQSPTTPNNGNVSPDGDVTLPGNGNFLRDFGNLVNFIIDYNLGNNIAGSSNMGNVNSPEQDVVEELKRDAIECQIARNRGVLRIALRDLPGGAKQAQEAIEPCSFDTR